MRVRLLGLGLAAVVFATTAACDEDLSTLAGPTPNLTPTFSSIQTEIFNTTDSSGRLACINCHNPAGRAFTAGLDLTSPGSYATAGRRGQRASGRRSSAWRPAIRTTAT